MKTLSIEVKGKDSYAIKDALEELMKLVDSGHVFGSATKEGGTWFSYTSMGNYEQPVILGD